MKIKWYISALFGIITFFCFFYQSHPHPNQEIVLKFESGQETKRNIEVTIAILKYELQNIGVNNFWISKNNEGALKIRYYSDADIGIVKHIVSKRIQAELINSGDNGEGTEYYFNQDIEGYNLDVHELQNGNDIASNGLKGTYVLELGVKTDLCLNQTNNTSYNSRDYLLINANIKTKLDAFTIIALQLHDGLYHVPEVRAGPFC